MEKVLEGRCGGCFHYQECKVLPENPLETWGLCSNGQIPVFITFSDSSPFGALATSEYCDAEEFLKNMRKNKATCFDNYPRFEKPIFTGNLKEPQ